MQRKIGTFLVLIITMIVLVWPVAAQDAAPSSGELALIGDDGNVYLYDVASASLTAITTDANNTERAYTFPTWSTDGRLAFFGSSYTDAAFYGLRVYVRDAAGNIDTLYTGVDEIFTYAYWSPENCDADATCRDLALLYTRSDNNLALRLVRDADTVGVTELSVGGPHYWDWSPDGAAMLWARYRSELAIYDVAAKDLGAPLDAQQGIQRAVDWSPTDDRLLTAISTEDNTSALVTIENGDIKPLVEGFAGSVSFMWSPDGAHVAYIDENAGTLSTIAADGSGQTDVNERVIAFWWSPDSTKIAFLQVVRRTGSGPVAKGNYQNADHPVLVWSIYDMASGDILLGDGFFPSINFFYYLNFYDQFARSHQLWSPDSRYLAYGVTDADGSEYVRLLDSEASGLPVTTVRAGSVGIFSWE